MNILAHLYLSGKIDALMLGNFMGDFVKGNQFNKFPSEIKKGILLHRQIDTLTDNHPAHLTSRNRFREKFKLHSGIVVDIIYDHSVFIKNAIKFRLVFGKNITCKLLKCKFTI